MSFLGWMVGAMVLDEFERQQDEIDDQDRALRDRDRRISELEARLRRVEGRGGSRLSDMRRCGSLNRHGSWN